MLYEGLKCGVGGAKSEVRGGVKHVERVERVERLPNQYPSQIRVVT
jgi:hypothetical protein